MFRKDQMVKIISTYYTNDTWGMNSQMQDLFDKGKPVRVQSYDGLTKCVRIKGYHWHLRDLEHLDVSDKKPQIFHFDEKHLEI
jgi:hypothetical protein